MKQLRERKGYTLEYVGSKVGKSKATISRYELGEIHMTVEMLVRLAEFYGVSIVKFFE